VLNFKEGIWNGIYSYLYLGRIDRIIRIYFACGEGPFGRSPHYPNDPVDLPARAYQPYFVCLTYKPVKRIEFGIEQSLAWQAGPVQLFSLK
jgi:hypothetical protein